MIPDTASLWAGVRKFEDFLKKDPQAYSFAPLADLYRSLGLHEDALSAARKGCAIHPDFAAGQMALARAALESSFKDEAKCALEAVVRITPECIEAQRLLADIYTAAGDQVAAQRCLGIVSSLEGVLSEPSVAAEIFTAEDVPDEDILELTDDLIEAEADASLTSSPFSADPERPSLGGAQHRAEPFLLETAPPIYAQEEQTSSSSLQPEEIEDVAPPAPVATATIAELYVSQGFPEKGVEVYRALLQGNPDNEIWRKRLAELSGPVADFEKPEISTTGIADAEVASESTEGVLDTLHGWLANIGRARECRTKSL